MEERSNKKLHIIEWIFAGLGALSALGAFSRGGLGILGGLIILVSAFVVSPLFEKTPVLADKHKQRVILQFVGGFVLLMIGSSLSPASSDSDRTTPTSTIEESPVSTLAIEDTTLNIAETETIIESDTEQESESTIEISNDSTETVTETSETLSSSEESTDEKVAEPDSEIASDTKSDPRFSKDDIASLLDITLSSSMGDTINSNVVYEDNAYVAMIWQDGFANVVATISETGTNQAEWQSVINSYVSLCNSLKETVDTADPESDSKVIVSILNDQNLENSLLTIENGIVTYDVLA